MSASTGQRNTAARPIQTVFVGLTIRESRVVKYGLGLLGLSWVGCSKLGREGIAGRGDEQCIIL